MDHPDAQSPPSRGRAPAEIRRDIDGLLGPLDAIDAEGREGPTATALLTYLRNHVVRPLVVDVGLRSAAAAQAEATAWEAVWLQLLEPSLRCARSPWGVLWQTARRALLSEILADRWGVPSRRAWELDEAERRGKARRPLSLEPLLAGGWQPAADDGIDGINIDGANDGSLIAATNHAAEALRVSGWPGDVAARIVHEIAEMNDPLAFTRNSSCPTTTLGSSAQRTSRSRAWTARRRGTSSWA